MSQLKPNTTYIYEHANGITYAREQGKTKRFEIGRTIERENLEKDLKESQLWGDIKRAAKTNSALQEALDRVKLIYELSRKDG